MDPLQHTRMSGILMYSARAYMEARNRVQTEQYEQQQSLRTLTEAVRVAAQMEGNEELYLTLQMLFYRHLTQVNQDRFEAWEMTIEELHRLGWTAFLDIIEDIRFFRRVNRTPHVPRLCPRAPRPPCGPTRSMH